MGIPGHIGTRFKHRKSNIFYSKIKYGSHIRKNVSAKEDDSNAFVNSIYINEKRADFDLILKLTALVLSFITVLYFCYIAFLYYKTF